MGRGYFEEIVEHQTQSKDGGNVEPETVEDEQNGNLHGVTDNPIEELGTPRMLPDFISPSKNGLTPGTTPVRSTWNSDVSQMNMPKPKTCV